MAYLALTVPESRVGELDSTPSEAPHGADGISGRDSINGLDEEITQFPPDGRAKLLRDLQSALKELRRRLGAERDPLVVQDLQILIRATEAVIEGNRLSEKYDIPYVNVAQLIFGGIRGLLDDQVPEGRRKAALVRLQKYTGIESGYEPLTDQAEARSRERRHSGQVGPSKMEVENDLARADFFLNGIGELFARYKIDGYEDGLARLKQQIAAYNAWVRQEILPIARTDFRLPAEQYAFALRRNGVDVPPTDLAATAHRAFDECRRELQETARKVARDRGLSATDYRDIIRALKKEQLLGDAIVPHYQRRLKEIEAIIRREQIVSLPDRPVRIRVATAAETVQAPAPHMVPPPLLNNTGQESEFVLPLQVPRESRSSATVRIDDFTFAAASWPLTAHEARPGHDLQFDSMIDRGVSLARSLFAFNSANAEGWAMYAEHIMQPYEPADGQLISLQFRLWRAARAFIDPELQSGRLTLEQAKAILTNDVVLSDAFANTEIERYTFRSPGQATSYFYGYSKLMELRREVERTTGGHFDQLKYHDFIIAQGLLPPELLRKAVLDGFVKAQRD
jgi:hypothetical protein